MTDKPLGVKVVGYLFIILGVLAVLSGLLIFVGGSFLSSIVTETGANEAAVGAGIFGAIAGFAGIIVLFIGAIQIFVGKSVLELKGWARIVATIFAVISLIGIPIGTIFGIITLYFLWVDKDTKAVFE